MRRQVTVYLSGGSSTSFEVDEIELEVSQEDHSVVGYTFSGESTPSYLYFKPEAIIGVVAVDIPE